MSDKEPVSQWRLAWLTSAYVLVAAVVYFSLARLDVDIQAEGGDKVAHVLAYALLTFWFMQIYVALRPRVAIAAGLVALGIMLEFLQGYTGYRNFDYVDMISNTIGVALGWIAAPPRTPSLLARLESAVSG
jgi:VanZ family protein